MMAKLPPLSEEERTNLVAYLDGELDGPAAAAMETKLNTDPRLRAEAATLRRTWELLDYLPKPRVTPTFTSRTLERVSAVRPATSGLRGRWRAGALGVSWAAAVLITAAIGYKAGEFLQRRPPTTPEKQFEIDPQLVRDLHVIENRHWYQYVDDVNFLRALEDPELFGEEN
jgi:hypothetical protein